MHLLRIWSEMIISVCAAIRDAYPTSIMALIWRFILKYQIGKHVEDQEPGADGEEPRSPNQSGECLVAIDFSCNWVVSAWQLLILVVACEEYLGRECLVVVDFTCFV